MTPQRPTSSVDRMVEKFLREAQLPDADQAKVKAATDKFRFDGSHLQVGITLNGPVNFYGPDTNPSIAKGHRHAS